MSPALVFLKMCDRLRNKLFTLLCANGFRAMGSHTVLALPIRLGGENQIEIGSHVFVGPQSWLEVLNDSATAGKVVISIGDRTSISGFCTITAVRDVTIESEVLIGRYVHISDHSHNYLDTSRPIKDQGVTAALPVCIRRGAWIGQGVVICPGVTIGRNAVIGANSVVRADVDDYCVAVGAPARTVRRLAPPEHASEAARLPALR
jgi:acetyltransferase-like isoleucine patch superfamily enzyme